MHVSGSNFFALLEAVCKVALISIIAPQTRTHLKGFLHTCSFPSIPRSEQRLGTHMPAAMLDTFAQFTLQLEARHEAVGLGTEYPRDVLRVLLLRRAPPRNIAARSHTNIFHTTYPP